MVVTKDPPVIAPSKAGSAGSGKSTAALDAQAPGLSQSISSSPDPLGLSLSNWDYANTSVSYSRSSPYLPGTRYTPESPIGSLSPANLERATTATPLPTGKDLVAFYYAHPQEINSILKDSGWYTGKTDPLSGLRAVTTFLPVWKQVIESASLTGSSIEDVLNSGGEAAMAASRGSGSSGSRKAPFQATVTSKEDLRTILEKVGGDLTGLDLKKDKRAKSIIDKYVKEYQGSEVSAQQSAYNDQSIVAKPNDASVSAESAIRANYSADVKSAEELTAANYFLSKFGGGGQSG